VGFNPAYTWKDFLLGMQFSVPFLLILTVHEFGHYFTARYHRVSTSLPYYIPLPSIPYTPSLIGTMGAVIRLRSRVKSNIQHFDIGLAGPLAGFIVALVVLWYGFRTLPPPDHIFQFHPDYKQYGLNYADHVYSPEYLKGKTSVDIVMGNTLLFEFYKQFVAVPERVPNAHEIIHYPILFAGFLALFFTSLNLLPIGQLDGGHIVYGLFGKKNHRIIASIFFVLLMFYSGLGYVRPSDPPEKLMFYIPGFVLFLFFSFTGLGLSRKDTLMYALLVFALQFLLSWAFPTIEGYSGWLLFGVILGRFIGIRHPASEIEQPLDSKRIVLGWLSLVIFIVCFSPAPIVLKIVE
jgi:membrane-associated protease RseP (regulator of RpoE activity)